MYLYIYVSMYLYIYIFLYMYIYIYIYISKYLYIYFHLYIKIFFWSKLFLWFFLRFSFQLEHFLRLQPLTNSHHWNFKPRFTDLIPRVAIEGCCQLELLDKIMLIQPCLCRWVHSCCRWCCSLLHPRWAGWWKNQRSWLWIRSRIKKLPNVFWGRMPFHGRQLDLLWPNHSSWLRVCSWIKKVLDILWGGMSFHGDLTFTWYPPSLWGDKATARHWHSAWMTSHSFRSGFHTSLEPKIAGCFQVKTQSKLVGFQKVWSVKFHE